MKRLLSTVIILGFCHISFAEGNGVQAVSQSASDIANYVPAIIQVCYVLAGLVAILGAISVYIAIHNNSGGVTKRIVLTVGSCLFFLISSLTLPSFFGIDNSYSGSVADDRTFSVTGKDSNGMLKSLSNGISSQGIIASIPNMDSKQWINIPPGNDAKNSIYAAEIYAQCGRDVVKTQQMLQQAGWSARMAESYARVIDNANK